MPSRRPPGQRWRRRLETEGEEVWGGEGREREGEGGTERWLGGGAGGRAGGRLQLPPASRGLQAAGRTQRQAIHSRTARGRPSPEPRAPSFERAQPPPPPRASGSLDTPPPPGRQPAPSKLRARLSAREKFPSPAAAGVGAGSSRCLWKVGGSAPRGPPCAPPLRPRGLGDPTRAPPGDCWAHGGGGGGVEAIPGRSRGSPGTKFYLN